MATDLDPFSGANQSILFGAPATEDDRSPWPPAYEHTHTFNRGLTTKRGVWALSMLTRISFTLDNPCQTASVQFLQREADTRWGRLTQRITIWQEQETSWQLYSPGGANSTSRGATTVQKLGKTLVTKTPRFDARRMSARLPWRQN